MPVEHYNATMPPPQTKRELLTLVLMIGLIGLVLIVTIILLMRAWRRHLERQKTTGKSTSSSDGPDIWVTSGERLLDEMELMQKEADAEAAANARDGTHDVDDDNDDNDPLGFDDRSGPDRDPDDEGYDDGYPREKPF